jgi:RNA polymerase sigma-70 factor (ECF subfamily)
MQRLGKIRPSCLSCGKALLLESLGSLPVSPAYYIWKAHSAMMGNSEVRHSAPTDRSKSPAVESLIGSARDGSSEALGYLLQTSREYLLLVASHELPTGLKAKEGASDLVQETFLVAQGQFHRFEGRTRADLLRWLRAILRNTSAHIRRSFRSGRRDASREVSLEADGSLSHQLRDHESSPSVAASHRELAGILRSAVERLSPRDRQVIWLKQHDGLTFEEMGRRLAISTVAARNAWLRAVEHLRQELERQLKPAAGDGGTRWGSLD